MSRRLVRMALAGIVVSLALSALSCTPSRREVVVYTSVDQAFAEPVFKDFERQTGIRVRAVYDAEAAKTTGLVNRLIAEKSRSRADVWWSGEIVQTLKLADQGVLADYHSAEASGIPDNLRDPKGRWTGIGGRARVFLRDTRNDESEIKTFRPRSLEDLARPGPPTIPSARSREVPRSGSSYPTRSPAASGRS